MQHIESRKLADAYKFKPLLDGNQLAKALSTKPGPWMKEALDVVMAWQLANPGITEPTDAVAAVQKALSNSNPPQSDPPIHTNGTKGSKASGEKQIHGEPLTTRLQCHFLSLTIRPLFSQTPLQTPITRAGHKIQSSNLPAPRNHGAVETESDSLAARPWKKPSNAFALDILAWCVSSLDAKTAQQHWGLVVPPVLALVDDVDVQFKVLGCRLLRQLVTATAPDTLRRTGMGEEFERAITPSLSYLPTLTPEEESVQLLDAAYDALIELGAKQKKESQSKKLSARRSINGMHENESIVQKKEELKMFVTALMHEHLFRSLNHLAPHENYPVLTTMLLKQLKHVVMLLEEDTVAHLNVLIPMISSVLVDNPLAVGLSPGIEMMNSAAECLQQVIANTWPRIWRWRGDIVNAVCSVHLRLVEETALESRDGSDEAESASTDAVVTPKTLDESLHVAVNMLIRAVDCSSNDSHERTAEDGANAGEKPEHVDIKAELQNLCQVDPRLSGLLPF